MLIGKSPIMVFDDSLSAVDAETDAKIRKGLMEKGKDSTVIIISHRITTLMAADNIIVLDRGRIVEEGGVHHIFADPKNEITKELISYVHQQTDTEIDYLHHKGKKIVKVKFLGTSVQEPIISKVIKEYGIDISVLGGTIDKLATMNIGYLYLELGGDLSAQDKAIELMGTMDVIVEVIYNGY